MIFSSVSGSEVLDDDLDDFNNAFFVSMIFDKYGHNNSITYEGFEHLLENLGLGKLKFETNHDVSLHKVNGTFMEFHDELSLHRHNHDALNSTDDSNPERKRRNLMTDEGAMRNRVAKVVKRKCLTPQDILITFGLRPYHDAVISPAKYLQICPAIIYELDEKLCQASGDDSVELSEKPKDYHLVWIYASISILVMGVSGILCVLLVPIIKNNSDISLLQFLVSLAAGTLCGDALIHLLPQKIVKAEKLRQSAFVAFIDGVKIEAQYLLRALSEKANSKKTCSNSSAVESAIDYGVFSTFEHQVSHSGHSDSTSIFKGSTALLAVLVFFVIESLIKEIKPQKKKSFERVHELDGILQGDEIERAPNYEHNHGEGGIKSVAWMAIMGDVLHNVTDGLSIGAAFTSKLSTGFASSIAIFCHELPHELGDYAILLASGMSVRKSLFYNILSSMFSLTGMVVGILLGEFENAALWINAFTAGSFLYIALTDLFKENSKGVDYCINFVS
ncbi:hypothetical protein RUM44_007385 [Polyplax serrata]|uniref:Uncharacterized protein n=1 Tax=Polyplax serrata TaxID=468196 RepID=A0ABR1B262_POLSC